MPARYLTLAALVVALALPAAALGQGAGDDQYSDPFGDEQEQPAPTATPVPAPAQPPAAAPSQAAPAQPAAPAASAPQLPRTGADAALLALAGIVLLAGGVALRVRLREPE
jgi:LPXTG-motif cell wall-anchored protein